jgi:hypothetical protein
MEMDAIKYQDYKEYRCIWLTSGHLGYKVTSFFYGANSTFRSSCMSESLFNLAAGITLTIYG